MENSHTFLLGCVIFLQCSGVFSASLGSSANDSLKHQDSIKVNNITNGDFPKVNNVDKESNTQVVNATKKNSTKFNNITDSIKFPDSTEVKIYYKEDATKVANTTKNNSTKVDNITDAIKFPTDSTEVKHFYKENSTELNIVTEERVESGGCEHDSKNKTSGKDYVCVHLCDEFYSCTSNEEDLFELHLKGNKCLHLCGEKLVCSEIHTFNKEKSDIDDKFGISVRQFTCPSNQRLDSNGICRNYKVTWSP